MKTYKIKPLEWVQQKREAEFEQHEARLLFGWLCIRRWWDSTNGIWRGWELTFQFDDWDDHHTVSVPSLKAGKEAATAEWHKRLSGALEEVLMTEHWVCRDCIGHDNFEQFTVGLAGKASCEICGRFGSQQQVHCVSEEAFRAALIRVCGEDGARYVTALDESEKEDL